MWFKPIKMKYYWCRLRSGGDDDDDDCIGDYKIRTRN